MDTTDIVSLTAEHNIDAVPDLTGMSSLVQQVLDVSPPVGLAIALTFAYTLATRIPGVVKWHLDFGTLALAALAYPLLADPGKVGFAARSPLAAQVVTGILIGAAAIAINPKFRALLARVGLGGVSSPDTQFLARPEPPALVVLPPTPTPPPTNPLPPNV